MTTIYHEHANQRSLTRRCKADDLFLVREGLQCGNCMRLIQEDIPEED